jgi:hypothetical protein
MSDWRIGGGQRDGLSDRVPAGYRIDLFAEQEAFGADDLIALWTREGRIDENEARRRVGEVLLVSGAPDGTLAAISTAYIDRDPVLELDVWKYRTLVAPGHREANLAATMAVICRDHLEHLYVSGADTRPAGVLSEVHSAVLKRLDLAVWRQTGFTFIGEDASGSHIRIHYFPGSSAPPPPADR